MTRRKGVRNKVNREKIYSYLGACGCEQGTCIDPKYIHYLYCREHKVVLEFKKVVYI